MIRIAMWSGPRNISTAMMRSWESRSDTFVIDEPFYPYYLSQTDVEHPGREEVISKGELDIDTLYYSKQSFNILSKWIASALNSNKTSYANILERCNKIDSKLSKVLISLNLEKAWDGITNAPTKEHFEKQFHRWFDAFKTLKLLKYYS